MKRIRSLTALQKAVDERRAVNVPKIWERHKPAAFIMSMQASLVLRFMQMGMYLHEPRK